MRGLRPFHPAMAALAALLAASSAHGSPQRLVTSGAGVTETVFALGLGDRVVGVDSSSQFPEEARRLPDVGYARALSAEGLLSLRPDLILASRDSGPTHVLDKVRALNVPVELVNDGHTVRDTIGRILAVGRALGVEDEAARLAESVRAEVEAARADAGRHPGSPHVLFLYARAGGVMNVAGTGTAADTMIALAGASNAVTGFTGYKPLTPEAAVTASPDVILMTTRGLDAAGGVDAVLAHPGLAATPAAAARRVVTMDDILLLGFGPRLGEAVRELADAIHGDAGRGGGAPVATARAGE